MSLCQSVTLVLCLASLTISSIAGENQELKRYHFEQALMATRFQIILYSKDPEKAKAASEEAFKIAREVEQACSDYSPTSELSLLLKPPATKEISPLLADVFHQAIAISKETHGAFDTTVGGHSKNWRFAKKEGKLPTKEAILAAKKITNWQNLTITKNNHIYTATKHTDGMKIDLGGIAKGYAADKMLECLIKHGITQAIIAAGGDILLGDAPPDKLGWRVGLKTLATEKESTPAYVTVSNCAVSTSGDIHQFVEIEGKRYSHIVDPSTGLGLTHRISATVIAANSTRADALATACCVQPEPMMKQLKKNTSTHALIVTLVENQEIKQSQSTHFPSIQKP